MGSDSFIIQIETRERPTLTNGYAILNYGPKPTSPIFPPAQPRLTLPNQIYGFLDYALSSFVPNDFPEAEEVTRRVTITVHQNVKNYTTWAQNYFPWTDAFPREPYLMSLYKNDGLEYPSYYRTLSNNGLDPVT